MTFGTGKRNRTLKMILVTGNRIRTLITTLVLDKLMGMLELTLPFTAQSVRTLEDVPNVTN